MTGTSDDIIDLADQPGPSSHHSNQPGGSTADPVICTISLSDHPCKLHSKPAGPPSQPAMPCPSCRSPWPTDMDTVLSALCDNHGIVVPDPPLPARHASEPSNHIPAAPHDILPLCCHRVLLIDPTRPHEERAWHELPDRHMEWAPNHNPHTEH